MENKLSKLAELLLLGLICAGIGFILGWDMKHSFIKTRAIEITNNKTHFTQQDIDYIIYKK